MKQIEIHTPRQHQAWLNRLIMAGYRIASIGPEGTVLSRPYDSTRVVLKGAKQ